MKEPKLEGKMIFPCNKEKQSDWGKIMDAAISFNNHIKYVFDYFALHTDRYPKILVYEGFLVAVRSYYKEKYPSFLKDFEATPEIVMDEFFRIRDEIEKQKELLREAKQDKTN